MFSDIADDHDVGITLVKTLQNTKYSLDEKLEQSFINLFSRKPSVSEKGDLESQSKQILTPEEAHDGNNSYEGKDDASSEDEFHNHLDTDLKEKVEFHDGRFRRRAVSAGDSADIDLEVFLFHLNY